MTEGVYRLAGSNIKINRLLSQFRSNAWSVQISREEYRYVGLQIDFISTEMINIFCVQ